MVCASPKFASEVQVRATARNPDHEPPLLFEAYETGTVIAPALSTASTAVGPANLSRAEPTSYGAVIVTGALVKPGLICSLLPVPVGWVTVQMLPSGASTASSK